jgi:hypothetical protein
MLKLPLHKPTPYKQPAHSKNRLAWASCTPFVDNNKALLIHRPKVVATYKTQRTPHIGITFWCGNSACGDDEKFTFTDVPPSNKYLCARCETAAVEAGLPSADDLAGHHVHVGKLTPIKTCCGGEE